MSDTSTDDTSTDDAEETAPGEDGRFDAEYVGRLRSEAAERRTRAKQAEDALEAERTRSKARADRLLALEVERITRGVLADPSDLLAHVAAADLLDADGDADPDKIATAAAELIARKAHLAPRTPTGDVDQGARGGAGESFDLAAVLRSAAG